jgi:hypothetical protein
MEQAGTEPLIGRKASSNPKNGAFCPFRRGFKDFENVRPDHPFTTGNRGVQISCC